MRHPVVQNDAGLSLVEALIAAALLAGMLAALGQLLTVSSRLGLTARDLTRGTSIAAQTLETLRAARPVIPHTGTDTVDAAGVSARDGGVRRGAYTRRWTVTPIAAGVWQVEVIVAPGDAPDAPAAGGAVRLVTLVGAGTP